MWWGKEITNGFEGGVGGETDIWGQLGRGALCCILSPG